MHYKGIASLVVGDLELLADTAEPCGRVTVPTAVIQHCDQEHGLDQIARGNNGDRAICLVSYAPENDQDPGGPIEPLSEAERCCAHTWRSHTDTETQITKPVQIGSKAKITARRLC